MNQMPALIIRPQPKAIVCRWDTTVVIQCQCEAKPVLILHDGAVACPGCGLAHQFVSFHIHGQPTLPAEVGFNIASFLPQTNAAVKVD